ncbi:ribonuclease H-like domain-containing protein [Candidatus Bathyarchaeota archaeon]|nr:ribonuclease H-like domain-containing protein [Candidatus Bathyarchaeota archaeon]
MSYRNRVYFDIETYPSASFGGKVITVAYKDSSSDTKVLKEWESDESSILKTFIEHLGENPRNTELIGFNTLRFDVPFIINRATRLRIDEAENLLEIFHGCYMIDLMHCLLPTNNFWFKGLSAANVAQRLGIPCPHHSGAEIREFYENKEYDKIEEHIRDDIVFTECLDKELRKRVATGGVLRF